MVKAQNDAYSMVFIWELISYCQRKHLKNELFQHAGTIRQKVLLFFRCCLS